MDSFCHFGESDSVFGCLTRRNPPMNPSSHVSRYGTGHGRPLGGLPPADLSVKALPSLRDDTMGWNARPCCFLINKITLAFQDNICFRNPLGKLRRYGLVVWVERVWHSQTRSTQHNAGRNGHLNPMRCVQLQAQDCITVYTVWKCELPG
mgnify:CR=1 FL=1